MVYSGRQSVKEQGIVQGGPKEERTDPQGLLESVSIDRGLVDRTTPARQPAPERPVESDLSAAPLPFSRERQVVDTPHQEHIIEARLKSVETKSHLPNKTGRAPTEAVRTRIAVSPGSGTILDRLVNWIVISLKRLELRLVGAIRRPHPRRTTTRTRSGKETTANRKERRSSREALNTRRGRAGRR